MRHDSVVSRCNIHRYFESLRVVNGTPKIWSVTNPFSIFRTSNPSFIIEKIFKHQEKKKIPFSVLEFQILRSH